SILAEQMPETSALFKDAEGAMLGILEHAYTFSRMLHGSASGDASYKAFVPELGSALYPRQVELVKRCMKSERGEVDVVGATLFPGLVKVSNGLRLPN